MKKKIIALLMAVALIILATAPMLTVSAANNGLEDGIFRQVKKEGSYRITIPDEGYVVVTIKAVGKQQYDWASLTATMANHLKKEYADYTLTDSVRIYASNAETKSTRTDKIPVSKGTYFVNVFNMGFEHNGKAYIRYSFTPVTQPKNYSLAKAKTLSKSKTAVICQTPKNNFNRWFKIKLGGNKSIKFSGQNRDSYNLSVYDADYNRVSLSEFKTPKLEKGTYYVMVAMKSTFPGTASYQTIKWK